jgi:hypothetical protein
MGTRGDENGWPSDGGTPDDLPDLPAEWGALVIPDDAAELDEDAALIRRELRRATRRRRWHRLLHLPYRPSRPYSGRQSGAIGVPLLIMSIAVLATLTSLSAVAWPTHPRIIPAPSDAVIGVGISRERGQSARPVLADLTVVDATGAPLRVRDVLPGVILLVDRCTCTELLRSTPVATDEAGIAMIAVGRSAPPDMPAAVPSSGRVWTATDPRGVLWRWVPGSPVPEAVSGTGMATVLLVDAKGRVVRIVSTVSLDDFRSDLAGLRER